MNDEKSLLTNSKSPQMVDVAKLAGVSAATVSRVLSNPDIVSAKTRDRVLAAVNSIGYTPNVAGRNLRAQRTNMVLVVVPDIANPFFSEVLRGIDQTLSARRYGIIIGNLDNLDSKEPRFVDLVLAGQVDGVLLLNGRMPQGNARSMIEAGVPVVALCEVIPDAPISQVEIDNRAAARQVIDHLVGLGHRAFGYIRGPAGNILEQHRLAGFEDGLAAAGLPAADALVIQGDFSFRAGVAAAGIFLALPEDRRPTAVFSANDEMAIGFMKTIRAEGVDVPGDVSVAGFDGIEYADFCEPTLTTVQQPRREIGATAATLLIDQLEGVGSGRPVLKQLASRFLVRGSTGPRRPR